MAKNSWPISFPESLCASMHWFLSGITLFSNALSVFRSFQKQKTKITFRSFICICLEFTVVRLPHRLLPSAETKFSSYQCPELSTKRREADKGNKAASTWCIWMFWRSLLSSMSLGVAKHLQFIYSIHLLEDESFLLLCPSLPLPAPCPHPLELATWQKITEVLFWKYFSRQMTCLPRCKASVTTPGRQTNSPTSSMLFWFLESLNLQMGETHVDLHRWNESISWNHSSQDSQRVL